MTGEVFFALGACVSVAAALLGWAQPRRAASATSTDLRALTLVLKPMPLGDRLAELERRAPPGTWEHDLAVDGRAASPAQRVAVVNMALADVEHALTRGEAWPRTGIRIALLGASFLGFAAFLGQAPITWCLGIVGLGVAGALACVEARRSAERHVTKQREAVDQLIATVFGDLPLAQGSPDPRRRRMRRR
jgi:hypothetical protein